MSDKSTQTKNIALHHGDCLEVMQKLIDQGVQVDSIVTDPPYELGFMGKKWDATGVAFRKETWELAFKLLKPGGHLLAFSGARTYHRMAVAIEDAGFEIRDQIMWIYGSGMPKSHDVSKAIDKAADYRLKAAVRRAAVAAVEAAGLKLPGNSRHDWTVGEHAPGDGWWAEFQTWLPDLNDVDRERVEGEIVATIQKTAGWFTRGDIYSVRAPATAEAVRWEGWGTAVKPAHEPIVLARKPLAEKTVAANILKFGTGAINIDDCRVDAEERLLVVSDRRLENNTYSPGLSGSKAVGTTTLGRWPANVIHDGSDEVLSTFPDAKGQQGDLKGHSKQRVSPNGVFGKMAPAKDHAARVEADKSAARFFYTAKASKVDRAGSKHPTVKPISLLRYLCRLVTPPGGTTLDLFAGSGTTGQAARDEGFKAILIEREDEYVADIQRRLSISAEPASTALAS